jgi:arylsulfatase A-like enzyme
MNLIMITLDGLRRDHITKVPSLLDMSKKSMFFSNIITAAPYTIASMHAIFSGTYPSKNGVNAYFNMFRFKKDNFKTLTRYMKDGGYHCCADVLNDSILPKDGFDIFAVHDENKDDLTERHIDILESVKEYKKFFLYLHYSNIHTELLEDVQIPYNDFSKEFFENKEENVKRYGNYMSRCNFYLTRVLQKTEELGLNKNSIIVILTDHGASVGEKEGERMYGSFVFDYTLKTFCVISVPGNTPKEITIQASSVDILPTILELLGKGKDKKYEEMDGISLLQEKERVVFSETGGLGGPWPSKKEHNVFCARLPEAKAIYYKTPDKWEFYDLKNDENEERPKETAETETEKLLKKEVENFIKSEEI